MDEFSFIAKYLSPLTFGNKEALSLKDDAAIIQGKPGYDIVITKDAIAEDTHFFKNDNPYSLAKKLLRVNLSDLAAKGAKPYCCFLGLILPENTPEEWLAEFARGLKEDMQEFGCFLAGGDTTAHKGGLVLSLTALGLVPHNKTLLRSGAKEDDLVFVTGTIGDSYLGLQILKDQELNKLDKLQELLCGKFSGEGGNPVLKLLDPCFRGDTCPNPSILENLISRYHIPNPRLSIGTKLYGIATACADISDGLLADLGHICECSETGAEIMLDKIPLSVNLSEDEAIKAITGGDDYELIFTAPANMEDIINNISSGTGIKITKIGKITSDKEVRICDNNNNKINIISSGYKHKV